jgi:hypothetical protein
MTGSVPNPNQDNPNSNLRDKKDAFSILFLASLELANASRVEDIREIVYRTLRVARSPATMLSIQRDPGGDEDILVLYRSSDPGASHPFFAGRLPGDLPRLSLSRIEKRIRQESDNENLVRKQDVDCLIIDTTISDNDPSNLSDFSRRFRFVSAAFIPVWHSRQLQLMLVLGSIQAPLTREQVQAFIILAGLASSAYDRVYGKQMLERRLVTLQALNVIGQSVALRADLNELYRIIHQQIRKLLGELTFFIALYDSVSNMVEIPYLFEMGSDHVITPPPFELGVGLTSIVIKNRQPLLLVENTAQKLQQLGAQQTGLPAKSWMGVPLQVAGETIGAIVVQDLFREHRFDEDDMQLMVTLAAQVAVTVRYVKLLEDTRLQVERERALNEITAQIRNSSDPQRILQTAAREIARVVGANRTTFVISPITDDQVEENL